MRRHQRPESQSRQTKAQGNPARIRRSLLQPTKREDRRRPGRAPEHREASQSRKPQPGPRPQERTLGRDPQRRRSGPGQTKNLLRNLARTNLPRTSNQSEEKTRRPPLRQSKRHLGRSRRPAKNPRLSDLHARRNPSPGHDHARHQRRQTTPGNLRRRSQEALPAALQFSAVLGGRGSVFARGWAAGDWAWGTRAAGDFGEAADRGELALHHARGLGHSGAEVVFFHGYGLRGFAFADGCGGASAVSGGGRRYGNG